MPICSADRVVWERPPARASLPRLSTANTSLPMVSRATSASRARLSTSSAPTTSWSSTLRATTRSTTSATSPTRCWCHHKWDDIACSSSMRCTCSHRQLSMPSSRLWRSRPSMPSSSSLPPRSRRLSPPSCRDARSMTLRASRCPTSWSSCSTYARTRALLPTPRHSM